MGALRRFYLSWGRLPDELRAELANASPLALEEGLRGSVTYRNFNNFRDTRGAVKSAKLAKGPTRGVIAVTPDRLVVWAGRSKLIDTAHRHPVRHGIQVQADKDEVISFRFELGVTTKTMSGSALVRLRTKKAAELADLLNRLAEPRLMSAAGLVTRPDQPRCRQLPAGACKGLRPAISRYRGQAAAQGNGRSAAASSCASSAGECRPPEPRSPPTTRCWPAGCRRPAWR